MKSKLISLTFIVLAIVGAFTTQAMNNSVASMTSIQGYVRGNPLGTVCSASIWCSDVDGPICMSGTTQIWGKDHSGRCIVELHRDTRFY